MSTPSGDRPGEGQAQDAAGNGPTDPDAVELILQQADVAMYDAKRRGNGRVHLASHPVSA